MKTKLASIVLLAILINIGLLVLAGNALTEIKESTKAVPEEEWNRTFGGTSNDYGNSVKQTQDGGYIIAGHTGSFGADGPDVYLVKIDKNGTEEWSKTFGGSNWDLGLAVQQTSDGGYIITGATKSFGVWWYFDIYLIKTDEYGNLTWSKTFGGWDWDEGRSVQQTSDGGYIITGVTESFGDYFDVFLLKTYENGSLEWIKTFKTFGGSSATGGESVQQTSDGGYIVVGTGSALGVVEEIYLIKTDEYGIEEWNKTFGGSDYDCASSVQQTADRGYIITGYTASFGNGTEDVYLIKTDEYGTEEWNKTFGGTDADRGKSVQQTADRGYIITGYTASFGNGTKDDVYLIKTDEYGTEEWNKTFGGTDVDEGWSVQQTVDGGYIIAGNTCSFGAGARDVWLIKVKGEPAEPIFDTEPSENPYPSIMGTHKGTIEPSVNITVNKMYTYPCAGTGGHTESIKISENGELIANGSWNGYVDDWHNITLHNLTDDSSYVTLFKEHTYNYTIITGSYPQIIHEPSKEVTGGTITCTLFTDANGKTYTDWIPAIRLE